MNFTTQSLLFSIPLITVVELSLAAPQIDKLLNKYKGNILSPEDTSKFKHSNLNLGYHFSLKYTYNDKEDDTFTFTYTLTQKDDNKYIFSISDGTKDLGKLAMFKNGVLHERRSEDSDFYPSPVYIAPCSFTLGSCKFKGFGGADMLANTEFKDGVWHQKISGRFSREQYIIYDKNGFLLYLLNKGTNASTEIVRVESIPSKQ